VAGPAFKDVDNRLLGLHLVRLGYTPAMNEALSGLKAEDLDDLAHYLAGSLRESR
jgi:hypothetical protein